MMRNKPDLVAKVTAPEPDAVTQLEDDGYPKTLAELDKWYVEPPEGQNAATYFFQGGSAIQVTNEDLYSQSLPLIGKGTFPTAGLLPLDERKAIANFVLKNEPAWKILQQGSPFEHARYAVKWTNGWNALFYHPAKLSLAVQLGALRTVLFAANKQPQQVADTFVVSLAVAQSLKDEPAIVSQDTRSALFAIQKETLEFTFSAVAVSSADLDRLAAALVKVEAQDSEGEPWTRAFVGSRVMSLSFFDLPPDKLKREIEEIQSFNVEGWTNKTPSQLMANLPAQRAFMMETFAHTLELRKEPFPQRLKIEEYWKFRDAEATNRQFYLSEAWFFNSENLSRREATGLANVRLMQTAVALEQFRRANRKYPDSLAELAPKFLAEAPVDPFNGEPLFYMKTSGYELLCRGKIGAPVQFRVEVPAKL